MSSPQLIKVNVPINLVMEVDPEFHTFKVDEIPQERLENICKHTVLQAIGPMIVELINADEENRESRLKLYFDKEEQSIIDSIRFTGMGSKRHTEIAMNTALKAVFNYIKKIGPSEVKQIINLMEEADRS